jgi:hypothetical protein
MRSVTTRTIVLALALAAPAAAQNPSTPAQSSSASTSDKPGTLPPCTVPPPSPTGQAAVRAASDARSGPQPSYPFDPAHYVKIVEETGDRRIVLYDPRDVRTWSTLLRADADSKIVIEIDPDCLGSDMALNALFISADLNRADGSGSPVKAEVLNYSEVATDPRTQASQAGVALRTAGDVRVMLQGLYDLTKDLIAAVYQDECTRNLPPAIGGPQPEGCTYQLKAGLSASQGDDVLRTHLRAFQPRIVAIADFFTSDSNALVLNEIGTTVFSLDLGSLKATAAKLKSDVAAFVSATPGQPQGPAGEDLKLYLERIWNDMQPLRSHLRTNPAYFTEQWDNVLLPRFRNLLAPGTIDLPKYKAADGDMLRVTIQARSATGVGAGGISHDFQIGIRKYHARVTTASSAFYLRRNGPISDDQGKPVTQTFAPAPGVTFGPVFYSRGMRKAGLLANDRNSKPIWIAEDTGWSRLFSALAPGIGINVSLMNFSNNDFDPSIKDSQGNVVGGFKTTTSGSIQVGTGVSASLFSNALQFTYGWNLSVGDKRSYWGIGFGFIEIGQEIAKVAKK